jgi:hypothetical protein
VGLGALPRVRPGPTSRPALQFCSSRGRHARSGCRPGAARVVLAQSYPELHRDAPTTDALAGRFSFEGIIMQDAVQALIESAYGPDESTAYLAFRPDEADRAAITNVGRDLLAVFPPLPGACALMSSIYACGVRKCMNAPCYVVAGSLYVGDVRVYGDDAPIDGAARFNQDAVSWDGHCWLMVGNLIVDASLFRTAYSGKGHPVLATHVRRRFGEGRGLFIGSGSDALYHGLRYAPEYVLNEGQIEGLARGALSKINSKG